MKESPTESKKFTLSIVVVVALCFLFPAAGAAIGQGGGSRGTPPTSVERRQDLSNRQASEYEIEKSSRDLKGRPDNAADQRRLQEIGTQIIHDFEGLEDSYNQLVLLMSHKDGVTSQRDSVIREVAEIKKYSTRLKTNLALPKPPREKVQIENNNSDLVQDSLLILRKHIYDFATNPLFESLDVLDVEQGRKAARDLDRIIELSESITKSAGKPKQPD